MSLESILSYTKQKDTVKIGLSQDRINNQIDNIRNLISFFREYPDLFVDFVKGPDSTFEFYFYQRVSKIAP